MAKQVNPKVFLVASTQIHDDGVGDYLNHIGANGWTTMAPSDGEELVEMMGRMCYKSYGKDLNPNLTKVREGNKDYIKNIIKSKHGSVLEHATVSFIFADVSRVFTHELVRHRAGTAISQESLRFVRLTDIKYWAPSCIREDETSMSIFEAGIKNAEEQYKTLSDYLLHDGLPFSEKKEITSALRRIAPIGLATTIGWTANIRTIRHVLETRTHPSAEEEIRYVFEEVGRLMCKHFPNFFQDFEAHHVEGYSHFTTPNSKI